MLCNDTWCRRGAGRPPPIGTAVAAPPPAELAPADALAGLDDQKLAAFVAAAEGAGLAVHTLQTEREGTRLISLLEIKNASLAFD